MRQMKDSGIEWIGDIPESWNFVSLKTVVSCFGRIGFRGYTQEDLVDKGEGPITLSPTNIIDSKISLNKCSYISWDKYYESPEIMVKRNDIVFVKTASVGKCAIYDSDEEATINPQFVVFKDIKCDTKYLYYVLLSDVVQHPIALSNFGSVIGTITQRQLLSYKICLPNEKEQKAISAHLDRQCGLIDNVIEKTKASIEEYKKLRQAVITQAVTSKGSQCKLSHISNLKNGLNYHDTDSERTIKMLGVGDFKDYLVLNYKEQFSDLPIDEDISNEYYLNSGDIIFVRSNGSKDLVGRSIMVDCIDYPLVYSGFCIRFRITRTDIAYNKYLLYYFRSHEFKEAIKYQCFGTNINNLSQDMISSLKVYLPSIEEQKEIADYLDKKCTEIDSLISKKEQFITELETYKKSLIYEYATGKKEVPQA